MREAVHLMALTGIALAAITILIPGGVWLARGAPQVGAAAHAERSVSP